MFDIHDPTPLEILRKTDHTCLKQDAVWEDIKALCDDAMHMNVASVCIPPSYVKKAYFYLTGRMKICTVIGFPNGYSTTNAKVYEAAEALRDGADEIDMVINIGWAKAGRFDKIGEEISAIRSVCKDRVLKVIVETCLLNEEEKIALCETVAASGADFIKTSTGFSTGGATVEDIRLFRAHLPAKVKIKAAGGIRSLEEANDLLKAGASRIGSSRLVDEVKKLTLR
ncbi:MAG: deoxyribose-phosphate aldolase [Ruminococcaceae bacterium]|nr:deoxyribose-phosphate aldolase [Oscillospiraceae bacterium]